MNQITILMSVQIKIVLRQKKFRNSWCGGAHTPAISARRFEEEYLELLFLSIKLDLHQKSMRINASYIDIMRILSNEKQKLIKFIH